jgi:hypothetical protein
MRFDPCSNAATGLHGREGNFIALVRFRTEISVGFYRYPAIFGCGASRLARGIPEGVFHHLL